MSRASRAFCDRVAMCISGLRISTSAWGCRSRAVTSPGPRASRRRVTGSSDSTRRTRSFRLSMMSVTSSFTPGMVVNSWRTSSNRMDVTAAPGMDDSRVRRRELPRVCPKPGSRGEMVNCWRSPSCSPRASTEGRWMMSMGDSLSYCLDSVLLGVELDDEGLPDGDVDVLSQGQVAHGGREPLPADLEPRWLGPVEGVEVVAQDDHGTGLLPHLHDVALADLVAGDGHPPAV